MFHRPGVVLKGHIGAATRWSNRWVFWLLFVQVKEDLSDNSYSDFLVFIRAVLGWRRLQHQGDREDRDTYLYKHSLSRFSLRFINGTAHAPFHLTSPYIVRILNSLLHLFLSLCRSAAGLISQFSENLHEAKLVSRASDGQRPDSLYNEHSNQDELLKAVLLAGLYPNLIQVTEESFFFTPSELKL